MMAQYCLPSQKLQLSRSLTVCINPGHCSIQSLGSIWEVLKFLLLLRFAEGKGAGPDVGAKTVHFPLINRRPVYIFQRFYTQSVADRAITSVKSFSVLIMLQTVKKTAINDHSVYLYPPSLLRYTYAAMSNKAGCCSLFIILMRKESGMKSIQLYLSPNQGKKLIADALASREDILAAAREHTVVVIMGTTNSYLAEALCEKLGLEGIDKGSFHRGILRPASPAIRAAQKYDLIIRKGELLPEKTIFDISNELGPDDLIFKGANAVHLESDTAGILIGHPQGGTIIPIEAAVIGKRATLIHPVSVEKRVPLPIGKIADFVNAPQATGLRIYPSTGTPYTELDAFPELFDVDAEIMAAGGLCGYEGGCLYYCEGEDADIDTLSAYSEQLKQLPALEL